MRRRSGASGFTLIEICVAIAIVALGIMTAMAILVPALRWAGDAKRDFSAAEAALSCVNYLNSGGNLNSPTSDYTDENGLPFSSYGMNIGSNPGDATAPFHVSISGGVTASGSAFGGVVNQGQPVANVLISVYYRKIDPATRNYKATSTYSQTDCLYRTYVNLSTDK